MSQTIQWLPYEPQNGGNVQWEVTLFGMPDCSDSKTAIGDSATFVTKREAEGFVRRLREESAHPDGVITIRAVPR